MSDLPPDLPRLRTLEHWLALSLDRVRARIAEVETRETAMRPVRVLPQGPEWVMSYLRVRGSPLADSVHIGDCKLAGPQKRPLSGDDARRALTEGGIRACEVCRPDSELGILD
ncbi:DUF6233 domain-containing protein [Streptomyces sp. NRRL WC-3549]|uniref:DUF6233 domain-containing protein n=1 Tax=Streptomyces sp. NRRL WC-3549 TaxID=1463925 RepID=UPI0004C83390|nr:DUF6233 domain-containing protein [Streptomyces sp. NRRL WC-3549]